MATSSVVPTSEVLLAKVWADKWMENDASHRKASHFRLVLFMFIVFCSSGCGYLPLAITNLIKEVE